jgi:hypothetical protein
MMKQPPKTTHTDSHKSPGWQGAAHSPTADTAQLKVNNQRQDFANQQALVGQMQPAPVTENGNPNTEAIQLKRRNKRAFWNEKQKAQNARLFRRRGERLEARAIAEERDRIENAAQAQGMMDIQAHMKVAQAGSFNGLPNAIQAVLVRLFRKGFAQQNSSPRAVFNKMGDFNECKSHATQIIGPLGHNLEDGVALNAAGQIKERYSLNYHGVNVIVRNFSSNPVVHGTIEFQTGVIFEFKYL